MASLIQCHSLNLSSSSFSFSSPRIKPQISPISIPLLSKNPRKSRSQKILQRAKLGDGVDPAKDPSFFDENGVVKDMDGYLNHLSLEYDSVWDTKPAWCQPWTIVLTGSGIITGSWLALNSVEVTSVATTLILLWWLKFLYFYPKEYTSMIAERRKKVTSGQEDTYGMNTERQS